MYPGLWVRKILQLATSRWLVKLAHPMIGQLALVPKPKLLVSRALWRLPPQKNGFHQIGSSHAPQMNRSGKVTVWLTNTTIAPGGPGFEIPKVAHFEVFGFVSTWVTISHIQDRKNMLGKWWTMMKHDEPWEVGLYIPFWDNPYIRHAFCFSRYLHYVSIPSSNQTLLAGQLPIDWWFSHSNLHFFTGFSWDFPDSHVWSLDGITIHAWLREKSWESTSHLSHFPLVGQRPRACTGPLGQRPERSFAVFSGDHVDILVTKWG